MLGLHQQPRALRLLRTTLGPRSALDLVRLLVFASLVYHGHVWLKVIVPFLNFLNHS